MIEREAQFLEVNVSELQKKLTDLGAEDLGSDLFDETIMQDKEGAWAIGDKRFVRLRKTSKSLVLSYKNHKSATIEGTEEIAFEVSDLVKAKEFLEKIGLMIKRHQQKKRHSYKLGNVHIDIDTWPKIPTYVEIEGESEKEIKGVAEKLGLNWEDALFGSAMDIIEGHYKFSLSGVKDFTFDKIEQLE